MESIHGRRPIYTCDSYLTAQNQPRYRHVTAGSVFLGAAWPGAAAPLCCDRIAAQVFPGLGTHCAAIVFRLKLKEDA